MAKLIPTYEKIMQFKVQPEPGELHLLKFLEKSLDDSFEVYFNPYMNGDRPDIIIMRKNYGVLIIEVKDWNLDLYELDDKKHWHLKDDKDAYPQSPIQQVLKYKENLYELHIENLLEKKIKNIRTFNIVACAVYFHNATEKQINEMLVVPFKDDRKYMDFLKYNVDLMGYDSLENNFQKILEKRYLIARQESYLFTEELYNSFKRFFNPPIHMKNEGVDFSYSSEQREIIYGDKKQQRIKGVVGSGKTTVLAARAVQAYKRLSKINPDAQILILTYNITLKNFIHDKISKVREDFPWRNFVILNYHLFINSQLNNLGIPIKVPDCEKNLSYTKKDCQICEKLLCPHKDISKYLDKKYYSNKVLFLNHKAELKKYDAIYIDEIQDYKRSWMDILKECFLSENGEYLLSGDVKQNIYSNITKDKDVVTNIIGKPVPLNKCWRSEFKIKDLAVEYQKEIFKKKYEIDKFNKDDGQLRLDLSKQGEIEYLYLPHTKTMSDLYTIIHESILKNGDKEISRNDITILGNSIESLRQFDAYYRYASNERTKTMFETFEMMYLNRLNMYGANNSPSWIDKGLEIFKRNGVHRKDTGFCQLTQLFILYDLMTEFPEQFTKTMDFYCQKFKTNLNEFDEFINANKNDISKFKKEVFGADYDFIRKNKKINFWFNSGTIKISSIHSFKGWESEVLFLIIEPKSDKSTSFDELLYTGITRCRSNLIIINWGNEEYDQKIKPLIKEIDIL